jgi:putative SOS response-associated peptidase YedK
MPGRLFLEMSGAALADFLGLGLDPAEATEMPARRNIQPGQQVLTWTTEGLRAMRWGIIPVGRVNARGRPVMETLINARSETVFDKSAYAGVGRGVVPVSGWYEWTGEARRKTAWRIAPKAGGLLFFAAVTDIWNGPGGIRLPQMATVTCAPNADVAPIHHRMGVLLAQENVPLWLSGSAEEVTPLMAPWPEGMLSITKAGDVDCDGP